ncbi:glycosyltransferase [Curtobacterium sp. MCBA15_001]|uniref:glycosyltransferase n=1 Tax=Curtobacterium sp. MCBA15_001 TaxID=1898731 RepID=UPI0008DE8A04|nr:glycosyltransferase [Curtobacterium sp. MCBA15_001]OIH97606.1 hypothetical protein BIU90_13560 [Curtobacterium sp. MCBA15_001]
MAEATTHIELSVVIVTFNSRHVLSENLALLAARPRTQVIVFDNASTDGTPDLIRSKHPGIDLIEGDENIGFARAVNRASERARGATLMLFNPDATISDVDLAVLMRASADHPRDVVAPFIEQPAPQRIVSAGRMPTIWRMLTHYSGLSRIARRVGALEGHYLLPSQATAARRVEWATGAVLVVPMSTWRELRGLSERWFMYAEDIEFCHRIGLSGRNVWLVPESRAKHLVGGSDSTHSMSTNPAWVLNLREFYTTDLRRLPFGALLWTVVVAGGLASRAAVAAARRGPRDAAARSLRSYSAALLKADR